MNKHTLYISSFNKELVRSFCGDLRNLGRKVQESIWGEELKEGISEGKILYLDSGSMGNLPLMASSLKAPLIEYVFFDFESGRRIFLISELLSKEHENGEEVLKIRENSIKLLVKRCKSLDFLGGGLDFSVVEEDTFYRTRLYRERKSLIKEAITSGTYCECKKEEIVPGKVDADVYITDAFTRGSVLSSLENAIGMGPLAVHIISDRADIYSPHSSVDSLVFKNDAKSIREALCAIYLDLWDSGKEKAAARLLSSFSLVEPNADFLSEVRRNIMKDLRKKAAE